MPRHFKTLLLSASALAIGATGVVTTPAMAAIDEIVVTARKRAENLQDIPLAVSAFSTARIENLGLQSIDDIARFTPGLVFSNTFGRATERPVIRGAANILASVQFGVESGTAYFVDGAYYSGDIQSLNLDVVERVEIIKGPQSALYGRNSYGGAINFVTKDSTEEFSGSGKVSIAEHDEYNVQGFVSGPIVEGKLGFTASARHFEYGGEYKNLTNDQTVGDEQTDALSFGLTFTPNEDLKIKMNTNYTIQDDGTRALALQKSDQNNCYPGERSNSSYLFTGEAANGFQYFCGTVQSAGVVNLLEPEDSASDAFAFSGVERDVLFTSVRMDYDLGGSGYNLSITGGYLDETLKTGSDSSHQGGTTTISSFFYADAEDKREDKSIEIRVESPSEDPFRWALGSYYYDQDTQKFDLAKSTGKTDAMEDTNINNRALFGSIEYDFTDAFTATLEGRYSEESKSDQGSGLSDKWSKLNYRVTGNYQVNDDILLYANYATGNKPGGFNGSVGASAGHPTYEPELMGSFELGAKTTWLDGRLVANIAAYYNDMTDYQLTTPVAGIGAGTLTSVVTNQGDVEVKGIELDVQFNPFEGLDMGATYAWTDAEIVAGCDSFQYVLTSGGIEMSDVPNVPVAGAGVPLPGADCSIAGNKVPMTAEHQASFDIGYTAALSNGLDWFIRSDVTYESSKFAQVHNGMESGDSTLIGARAGIQGENWSVSLFGRNLTDEDSVLLVTRWFDTLAGSFVNTCSDNADCSIIGPRAGFYGLRKGRQIGVEAKVNF